MAKSSRNNQSKNKNGNQSSNPLQNIIQKIKSGSEEAMKEATEETITGMVDIPPIQLPEVIDQQSLQAIWNLAEDARKSWISQTRHVEDAEKRANAAKREYESLRQSLEEREEKVDQTYQQLNRDRAELEEKGQELLEKERECVARDEALRGRELDAENGFLELHKQLLSKLDSEMASLRQQQSELRMKISEEAACWEVTKNNEYQALEAYKERKRSEIENEYQHTLERLDGEYKSRLIENQNRLHQFNQQLDSLINQRLSEIAERENDLVTRENQIDLDKKNILKKERNLNLDQELLDDERKSIDEKINRKVALEVENLKAKYEEVQRILADVRSERDRVYQLLYQRDQAIKKFGNQTPEEIQAELNRLKNTVRDLQEQLNSRPSSSVMEQLKELRETNDRISTERARLLQNVADLRRTCERQEMSVLELETLRDQKALLETALTDLRTKVRDLTQKKDDKPVFPACCEMDKPDNILQEEVEVSEDPINLKDFVEDLRHRIGYDPKTKKTLYYSLEDIRAFLGGLAMSKLHLLQGISGTGKTSLPLAFARAVGGETQIVEVQASWRDREDLIGHFNAFENRFHETEFLQAIYKAQTPACADRMFFVILDEMNLSHPEQYFADLLSALELDTEKRLISLMPEPVVHSPRNFIDGRLLHIPSNIWFIGTANHDETTTDFAPKTYDRSFVLELPEEYKEFPIDKNKRLRSPISFSSLSNAFLKAQSTYGEEGLRVYQFITKSFGNFLGDKFRIGWGNRLERQVMGFVPVTIASGGTPGEAADFILATKILRKIKDRIENRPQDLKALDSLVTEVWKNIDKNTDPVRSLSLIEGESKRLGGDFNAQE